jgi:hypothetical protein
MKWYKGFIYGRMYNFKKYELCSFKMWSVT